MALKLGVALFRIQDHKLFMTDSQDSNPNINQNKSAEDSSKGLVETKAEIKKGPLSFFSGACTSLISAWLCYRLSQSLVIYFSIHTNNYNSAFAQSIASGFKTLVIGISFLATFTFTFIGFGLTIVFIRSLFDGIKRDSD